MYSETMRDSLKYVATGIFLVAALMWLAQQHKVFLIALQLGMMYSITYAACYVLIRWVKDTFFPTEDPCDTPAWIRQSAHVQ